MKKKKIVVFSPHADDAEIAMGGTIAKLSKDNKVTIVTAIIPIENIQGEKNQYMVDNRLNEQKKSAKILGANLIVLNINQYEFSYHRKYIQIIDKLIFKLKPDIVFSCWEHDTHQDHQTLSKIIYSALRKNNISLYLYEAMLPGGINSNVFNPTLYLDISKQIKKKINSLNKYKSVFKNKNNTYGNYYDSIIARAKFRGGCIGVKYAEAFQAIKQINFHD
jgi:LmbE family N-acetylglucosaminyl deacetylase